MIGEPSTLKLERVLLVMRIDFPGRRVGRRVLSLKSWRSEKVRRWGMMWYGNMNGSAVRRRLTASS